jgi:hypothetical protein
MYNARVDSKGNLTDDQNMISMNDDIQANLKVEKRAVLCERGLSQCWRTCGVNATRLP